MVRCDRWDEYHADARWPSLVYESKLPMNHDQDQKSDNHLRARTGRGIPIRSVAPNMVTAMALCTGLSSVWFALSGRWEAAVVAILVAGVLDGLDGRIARLLRGESRFGAELDSLSDNIAFGVSPALVSFIWALQFMPRFGWTIALFYALCCALRLARFNAQIDDAHQPHKSAGFLTGVPAPAGAAIAMLPLLLWLALGELDVSPSVRDSLQSWYVVGPWLFFAALLMISSIATFSASSLRLRRRIRFEAIAIVGLIMAAMITAPYLTLAALVIVYLLMIPISMRSYRKARHQSI